MILLAMIITQTAYTQELLPRHIPFQTIGISDGLSQGMVNSILQDRKGFMWFATKDGLNRYDGYRFIIYRHDPQDSSSIADSYVQTLLEDSKGRIWIGTSAGDVDRLDQQTGKFEHVIRSVDFPLQQGYGSARQLAETREGKIWVLFTNQIMSIDPGDETKKINSSVSVIPVPAVSSFSYVFIAKNGDTYFSDQYSSDLFKYDRKNSSWKKDPVISGFMAVHHQQGIFRIFEDTIRKEFVAVNTKGVISWSDTKMPQQLLNCAFIYNAACTYDAEGRIWFTQYGRLGVLNNRGQFAFFDTDDHRQAAVLGIAHTIYFDRSGLAWIGSKGLGMLTLNYQALAFHHTDNGSISGIYQLDDGRIKITRNNAFETFNPETGQFSEPLLAKDAIHYFDDFNELTYPRGMDGNGRFWLADDERLACYDPVSKKSMTFPLPVRSSNVNYQLVSDIKIMDNGQVWLATAEGVLAFIPAQNKWIHYKNNPSDTSSLSFNAVFSLCKDPKQPTKYIWIGTNGGGLNRMEMATGKCRRYADKQGLSNNVVYGILPDDNGRLWMSTNKGISRLDPATGIFKNYEDKDGLQSNEFNHNAYVRTNQGLLFFGGVNGFNYFHPREIVDNPVVPKIALTDFRIRNQSTAVPSSIRLSYSDNMISFEFAALDFIAPKKNMYRYKLENFDKDWINAGNINTATYTNLDPGHYVFTVKGSNNDGVWNE
jgi:ligand-binding sensor domain-containing protein